MPIVLELTVKVDVAVPPGLRLRLVGLTLAANPATVEGESATVPENPPILATVRATVPGEPAKILTVGKAETRLKSADWLTLRDIEAECERPPLVPVTMIV